MCLAPRDVIEVRNMVARCHLGVSDEERHSRQQTHISLELGTDADAVAASDDLAGSFSYSDVARSVIEIAEAGSWRTMERLATSIAKHCLESAHLSWVRVRVEKTGALRIAESAGISVTRCALGH